MEAKGAGGAIVSESQALPETFLGKGVPFKGTPDFPVLFFSSHCSFHLRNVAGCVFAKESDTTRQKNSPGSDLSRSVSLLGC